MKLISKHTEVVTDLSTGEISESSEVKVVRIPAEPPYIKMYIDDISRLIGLTGFAPPILLSLLRKLDYESIITISSRYKSKVCADLKIKRQTYDNYLQVLKKAGIIKSIGRSEFVMNPHLFAKGKWYDVRKLRNQYLTLTVTYNPDGERTITSMFDAQENKTKDMFDD